MADHGKDQYDDDRTRADRQETVRVYIGLGGNTGARALLIDEAVRRVAAEVGPVVATSFLYETAPQLVTDQPAFLNAAILVESRIADPHALMRALQGIEAAMGRAPLGERLRYGPRPIDLDILCYDDGVTTVGSTDLVVPHALLRTRSFVLQPLSDIRPDLLVPSGAGPVGGVSATVAQLWGALLAKSDEPLPRRVLPLGAHRVVDLGSVAAHRTPLLMAIVNATPDSFSGDGIHTIAGCDVVCDDASASLKTLVEQTIVRGADVVDVGGYSTRPGHATVSVDDEMRRVMRVVSSIAKKSSGDQKGDEGATAARSRDLLLSIDTFRPEVAQACIEALAPAHDRRDAVVWINDVMGMRCDPPAMCDLLRRHDGVGIVIMHSRGALDSMVRDPAAAANLLAPHTKGHDDRSGNNGDDIVAAVARDLLTTAAWAEAHGVARWRIVLDPGIGFGKSLADNVALAGGAARLRAAVGGYPVLIGASRKSFLGKATAAAADKRARDAGRASAADDDNGDLSSETRQHASHAVTAIAAWEGAHIVRVHDVVGSRAVLDIAAALANGPASAD